MEVVVPTQIYVEVVEVKGFLATTTSMEMGLAKPQLCKLLQLNLRGCFMTWAFMEVVYLPLSPSMLFGENVLPGDCLVQTMLT